MNSSTGKSPQTAKRKTRHRLAWCAAAALLAPALAAAQESLDSKGTDFWVGFPLNYLGGGTNFSLFVSGEEATIVNVEVPSLGFVTSVPVEPGIAAAIALPPGVEVLGEDVVGDEGIKVFADREITVYGLSRQQYTTDAYLGLPNDVLGLDHMVLAWGPSGGSVESEYLVVGTVDGTAVSITPTSLDACGTPVEVVLNAGQTWRHASCGGGDVSGTVITSDQPVAVYGGHECANIPNTSTSACDHVLEQLPATPAWGRQFLTAPLATRRGGDTFRVLASVDATEVLINGELVATLARGAFYQTLIDGPSRIDASQPVLVSQYSNGSSFDDVTSDPFMMMVPPFEQFLDSYTFAAPTEGFSQNFANVVVSEVLAPLLELDGTPIDEAAFVAIPDSGFVYAQLPIAPGSHTLNGAVAGLFVYGFDSYDSYGYPGGLSLSPVASVSTLALSPEDQSATIGDEACVDATVQDQDGNPLADIRVDFEVTGVNPLSASQRSGEDGIAQFCWSGAQAGDDTVTATVGRLEDTATVQWTDQPLLQFDPASYSIAETGGVLTLTVVRVGGDEGEVSVDFSTANGTATAGADFSTASGTLSWADGDATARQIQVTVQDDLVLEGNETFAVTLTNPLGAQLGGAASAAVTVQDNDVLTDLSLSPEDDTAQVGSEYCVVATGTDANQDGVGLAGVAVEFTVSGSNPSSGTVLTDASGNASFCWTGSSEGDDTITATFGEVAGTATVEWANSILQFEVSGISVDEDAGSARISVVRINGSDGAVSVQYATSNGSAGAGSDYTGRSGTLSWADGDDAAKTISVPLLDDLSVEGDETFRITLSSPVDAALGSPTEVTVTIVENDVVVDGEATAGGGSTSPLLLALLGLCAGFARSGRALRRGLLAVLTLLPLASTVQAQGDADSTDAPSNRWSIGVRGGLATYLNSPRQIDNTLDPTLHDLTLSVDDEQVGGVLYAGLWLRPWLSTEVGYVELGEYDIELNGVSSDPQGLAQDMAADLRPAGRGGMLGLAGHFPVWSRWEVIPRLSAVYYESTQTVRVNGIEAEVDDDGVGIALGVTMAADLGSGWSLGAGVEGFWLDGESSANASLVSVQLEYRVRQ